LLRMWYHVNEAGYEKLERDSGEKKAFRGSVEFTSCLPTPRWLPWNMEKLLQSNHCRPQAAGSLLHQGSSQPSVLIKT
ncbi:unnamed protein product, partial [Bubo scandiacus]